MIFAVTWVIVLWSMGLYRLDARWRLFTEARDIAKTSLIVLALTLSTLFLVKQQDVRHLFIAFLFVAQPTVTLAGRAILRWALRSSGTCPRRRHPSGSSRGRSWGRSARSKTFSIHAPWMRSPCACHPPPRTSSNHHGPRRRRGKDSSHPARPDRGDPASCSPGGIRRPPRPSCSPVP